MISAHLPRAAGWPAIAAYTEDDMTGTKDEIDWSHVAPEFEWMARDKSGHCRVYSSKPEVLDDYPNCWLSVYWRGDVKAFASYKRGTCDWRNSLVRRPE